VSVRDVGVLSPNGWTDQDETWLAGRSRPRPHCVRWGPSSSFPKGAQQPLPHFSAHVCCGQTARCTRISLGTEIGLGPGDTMLDRNPAPPRKGAQFVSAVSSIFLLPVWAYALVGRRFSPFLQSLSPYIAFLDH